MRIIGKAILDDAMRRHGSASRPLRSWLSEAESAQWSDPHALKERYPRASIIGNNRVVFNIKGNDFRLVTQVNYERGFVRVRFFGTHAEYNRIDASEV